MAVCTELVNFGVGELLEQWGKWSCSGLGGGGLGTPSCDNTHWISDDAAQLIDRAVAQLGLCDDKKKAAGVKVVGRKRAVMLYYINRYNVPMVANALRVGETKAKTVLLLGESWIEGYLELQALKAG